MDLRILESKQRQTFVCWIVATDKYISKIELYSKLKVYELIKINLNPNQNFF